jgi:Uri superfamily endonuclease
VFVPNGLLRAACFIRDAAEASTAAGAYLLLLNVVVPLCVTLPRRAPASLPAGRYLYAGSAHGPGGLRARLARHLRRD